MVSKTITITQEAYKQIKCLKQEGESFSQLFLRLSGQSMKVKDLFGILKLSDKEYEGLKKRTKKLRLGMSKDIEERQREHTRHLSTH